MEERNKKTVPFDSLDMPRPTRKEATIARSDAVVEPRITRGVKRPVNDNEQFENAGSKKSRKEKPLSVEDDHPQSSVNKNKKSKPRQTTTAIEKEKATGVTGVRKKRNEHKKEGINTSAGKFGIRTPPLLDYLQGILRGYSDGQILKELLQNAEDAGASEIRFLYDENHYGTDFLLADCLAEFQGPALCSYNNAVFEDRDWEGIQKPAQSCKKKDVLKVGRFGIGFNSVYHLTDLPCIISRNVLAMIDPFEKYFQCEGRPSSGYSWDLSVSPEDGTDQLKPIQEAFPLDVKFEEHGYFPGTFFRFPLRKKPNILSRSVFSLEKVRDLLEAFKEDARIVLLFLRSVESAAIYWKKELSQTSQCFLKVSFSPSCLEELRQQRKSFTTALQNFKENPDSSDNIEIIHTLDIDTKCVDFKTEHTQVYKEKWVISQEIAIECSNELAKLYRKLNFLPWLGVAVPVFNSQQTLKGRTFCFLPLPQGEDSLSGLPVHVHGFFGVSDDRRSLKWPSGDQIQNDNAEWNKLLVNEVLPRVYRKALLKAIDVTLEQNDLSPDIVYKAIPNINGELSHWREAVLKLLSSLFQEKVLYCRAQNAWMSANEVVIMTHDLPVTSERTRVLVKCLQKSGFHIIEDLPRHVRNAIGESAPETRYISPSRVIKCLQEQSINEYSDEDRLYILDYLLEKLQVPEAMDGLELLPTCDDGFVPFKTHPNTSEVIFMSTSIYSQNLLPGMPHRFLKHMQESHFSTLNQALEKVTSSDDWKQLKYLDADAVIQLLPETLPSSWNQGGKDSEDWIPSVRDHLNLQWLELFWQFMCREDIDLLKLEGLKILPVSDITKAPIKMMPLRKSSRIIHVRNDERITRNSAEIEEVLTELGVIVCELPDFVCKHHQILNSSFVHFFHQDDIMKVLKATGAHNIENACFSNTDTQGKIYSHLLPYLSGKSFSEEDRCFIRGLSIFRTFQNRQAETESLTSINSGVPVLKEEDFRRLPQITFHQKYIRVGSNELLVLLEKLGVKPQSFEDVLRRILRDAQQGSHPRHEIQVLFEWVRLHYDEISSTIDVEDLKEISFVPNGYEQLRKPKNLYDSSNKYVKWLVLDKEVLLSDHVSSSWLDILLKLGLQKEENITPDHLMKAATNISSQKNVSQATVLMEYICNYPQRLQNSHLRSTLRQTPFIPCKDEPPPFYPQDMPFFLQCGVLYKPSDLVVYSDKMCHLAGGTAPMVDRISDKVLDQLCVRRKPSVEEVLQQMHKCVVSNTILSQTEVMHHIYEYLNENIASNQEEILNGLPEKWILVDDQFKDTKSVYKEEGPGAIDLRPFLCILPRKYKEHDDLLRAAGVPDQVDENVTLLVDVLEKIKSNVDTSDNTESVDLNACLRVSINILRRLVEFEEKLEDERIKCRLYVPTSCNPMKLLPPDQVCYDDIYDGDDGEDFHPDEDEPPIYLVHNEISSHIAKKLGVMSLTKRLAGADEIGALKQTGQYEPLTVRLRNILRDGYQPESIPKEMVQNAEDAGASEVKFLLDLRTNTKAAKKLLDPAMEAVHGPALWVYNDAAFTEEDLQNITKLGGATKREDRVKIGQFGLGFNVVYHVTDVPSFVTGNFITFFDPHKSHLQRHIRGEGSGIQINFTSNPSRVRRFRDQFLPYEGIFGCKMLGDEDGPKTYKRTLFRLPLRSEAEALKSEIWNESYNEERMKVLLKSLCHHASQMLLFTENVKSISVYLLNEDDDCKPSLLYELVKSTKEQGLGAQSYKRGVYCAVAEQSMNSLPLDATSVVTFESRWSEKGKQYLQLNDTVQPMIREEWVVTMSAGRGRTYQLCLEDVGAKSGLLPCGGVAWNANENTAGGVFCFLPLSVPQSGLPVCINGSFAVSVDRRSLWRDAEVADFKTRWNQSLFEDVIVSAYITLLQQTMVKEKCGQSFILWPNPQQTSKNSDYGAVMTAFYRAIISDANNETPKLFMKKDVSYSVKEVVFTVDEIQDDDDGMFPTVERVLKKITSKEVLKIPTWVRTGFVEAECSSDIMSMTYSWKRFFEEVFLPNLSLIRDEDISRLIRHALSEHDDIVLDLMKDSKCIPAKTPFGRTYKKPSCLLDPSRFKDIFSEDEGVFPDDQFLEALDMAQKGTLKDIGCLKDDISWEDVLERAQTVQSVWMGNRDKAILRVKALLSLMDHKLQVHPNGHESIENDLREVAFLPAVRDKDENLQCPSNVYLAEERDLVGYVCYILDTSKTVIALSLSVSRLLGMDGKKVRAVDVIENLRRLKEMHSTGFLPDTLQRQCESIHLYLQEHLAEADVLHFVQHNTFFCLEEEFIETNRLAFASVSIPPYLFHIPPILGYKFRPLLNSAGVKESFDHNDFIRTLKLIKEDMNGEPLDQHMVSNILKIIKLLFDMAEKIPADQIPHILLPDSKNMLQPSGSMSYCDLDSFKHLTSKYNLCHAEISSLHAKALGVRDIREQMLKKYSQNLPDCGGVGENFGQREELVTRITRIMEGYPFDFSILKELVQNADDAEATKVHFVLDERSHPTNRLFYDSMSRLQGPALLAFNDRPFTDDDIRGIQRLGEGSKSDATDKTGRYGVGFNVVYHLTDCPMFLSAADTFCIFDPTLQYVSDANAISPGRMFRPIDREMLDSYSDLFNCFFSFRNDFNLDEGTLFRFPLRQRQSEISGKIISPLQITDLFAKFKDEMFEIFLFLKNVTEISFSTCANGKLDATYKVTSNVSLEHECERQQFFRRMREQKEGTLLNIAVSDLQYETVISDNHGHFEQWLVHQRMGIANKEKIPESVKHANTVTNLRLFPKGGIAAKWTCNKSGKTVSSKRDGKVFCFLPLPIRTNLPVHMDGYFALGHEARQNLWKAPDGDAKSDWNRLIVKEIIAPLYVHTLEKMKEMITDDAAKGMEFCKLKDKLQHYHSFFPLDFKTRKTLSLDAWDELGQEFYQKVTKDKCMLFPVVHSEQWGDTPGEKCQVGKRSTYNHLMWTSCVFNADNEGYFDVLPLQMPHDETVREGMGKEKEKQKPKFLRLRHLLLNLGFPLLETPVKICNIMEKIFSSMESKAPSLLKISPENVEKWLKAVAKTKSLRRLPLYLKETRIASNPQLKLLVEYVVRGPELKLCGLPLLLTNDGVLREFSTKMKVFHSNYYSLLPNCSHEFLHHQFLRKFNEQDECFAVLKLSHVVERLPTYLPKEQFCTGKYTQWSQDTHTTFRTPRIEWIRKLWQFLFEMSKTFDCGTNVVETLGSWSILPVHEENKDVKFLVPLKLAKTVISSRQFSYHMKMEQALKDLHCPVVDIAVLKNTGLSWVRQPQDEALCQFVMTFSSNLDRAEHTLLVFERLVKYKLERFKTLEKESHRCILKYFSKQAGPLSKTAENLRILKSLPCFETIHGDFVALTGKTIYAVVIDDVPKCDQDIWLLKSGYVFLKDISDLAELFKILRVERLSDIELYRKFILPYFGQFSIAGQWKHLSKIIDMVLTNLEPKEIIITLSLHNIPVVPQEDGNPRLAGSFCDENNLVFREMLDRRHFPPEHPNRAYQIRWLRFLRLIGMQTHVSCAQFEDFANKLSDEPSDSRRENILLHYFFDSHHLHNDRNFLERLGKINFISPANTPNELRELHQPCGTKKVSLSAVPEKHQRLVWTKEAVLPTRIHLRGCPSCNLENVFLKTKEPSLNSVLLHTQTLCCALGKKLIKHENIFKKVIMDILEFLSERCDKVGKCERCCEKLKCCSICKRIVTALEDIPLIPLQGGELFKAKRLTKHLPKKENDKLFLFLKQLPDHFTPYCSLLYCMGTTEEPSLVQYASILKLIKQQKLSDQHNNPNILKAAEQAEEGFFRILEYNGQPSEIDELYLLTNKKEWPLLKSNELYYNDEPSYVDRLKCFPHPLMRAVDESAVRSFFKMEKLVRKLDHLKPHIISETVDEIETINDEKFKPESDCECTLSLQLKKVFSWPTYSRTLKIILDNEGITDDTLSDEIYDTNFTVKCLDEIPTELRMKDGTVIPQSQRDAGVLFRRIETNQADVLISHSACDTLIQIQIADGFNHYFGDSLKSTKFLEIFFFSKSEEEVIPNLIKLGLKTTSDELQDLINNPVLGSEIEEDVTCLLMQDLLCCFSPNEYVGYNDTCGADEHLIYAKIIRKVDDDIDIISEDENYKVKYVIEVDGKNQIEVDAVWLYRFTPPQDEPTIPVEGDTHLYNPNGPSSSSTDIALFQGQSRRQESSNWSDDYTDLDKTKQKITKIIEDLWKQDDSFRRTALRRLMRKWHPDKNEEQHKAFAEEVFKRIRREIDRMENGISSGVDTDHDIFRWTQKNTADQRQYWRFHKRRYGKKRRRGRGFGGGNWNSSSPTGFKTPPSFHKINLEAMRWLKQARIDLEAAATVASYQWKSSLCFFAVEKSVKAAQLVCGCGIKDNQSIMDATLKLKRHLDVKEAIQQLVQIVTKDSHYPSSCSDNSIPHEKFTKENADEANNIAQKVIEKVDNYIKHG